MSTTAQESAPLNAAAPGSGQGLVWLQPSGAGYQVTIWDMGNSSLWSTMVLGSTPDQNVEQIGSGDFNGDGHGDLLWRIGGNQLAIWNLHDTAFAGQTTPTFNAPAYFDGLGDPHIGDINGDQTSDIVWTGLVPGVTHWQFRAETWIMKNGLTTPAQVLIHDSPDTELIAVGNFDGDMGRHSDYLYRNRNDGTVTLQPGTASTLSTYAQAFDQGDTRGYTADGAWAGASHIGQCKLGDAITGISTTPWFTSSESRAHSALCTTGNLSGMGMPENVHSLTGPDDRGDDLTGDWDYGYYKAECAQNQVVTGVAQDASLNMTALLCSTLTAGLTSDDTQCQPLVFSHTDNTRLSDASGEWAQNYIKNECRPDQFLKGISRNTDTGEIHAILCCDPALPVVGSLSSDLSVKGVGDFNHDGLNDLLLYKPSTGDVLTWTMSAAHTAQLATVGNSPSSNGYTIQALADINADGTSDIVWWNETTGRAHVWVMASPTSVAQKGADMPGQPAQLTSAVDLGPPDAPRNIRIFDQHQNLGVQFDATTRHDLALRTVDVVQIYEVYGGMEYWRGTFDLAPRSFHVNITSPWRAPWQTACFKLRQMEDARYSAFSSVFCNNQPLPPPPAPPPPPTVYNDRLLMPMWEGQLPPTSTQYIWYGGMFPPVLPARGHAVAITNLTNGLLSIPMVGASTEDCGNPSKTVTLNPQAKTSSAQMTALFGTPNPALPINVVGCTSLSPLPDSLVVQITYTIP